jgi:hypothetical protein
MSTTINSILTDVDDDYDDDDKSLMRLSSDVINTATTKYILYCRPAIIY